MITFKEYLQEERVDEITTKQVIAAGAIAAAALGIHIRQNDMHQKDAQQTSQMKAQPSKNEVEINKLTQKVLDKFKHLDEKEVKAIVTLAKKYEKPGFPRAQDILAIISIESSFNPNAVSGLKKDPAIGLMQVRPAVWDINPKDLQNDVNFQVQQGAEILHKYFTKYETKEAAIEAFNIGETAFRKMHVKATTHKELVKNIQRLESAKRYTVKFNDALSHFKSA